MSVLDSPQARVIARALLAGAAVFVTTLQAGDGAISLSLVEAALSAAGLAALEYITPLNALVGYFKNPPVA
jgi:hypothetical protein